MAYNETTSPKRFKLGLGGHPGKTVTAKKKSIMASQQYKEKERKMSWEL